MSGTTKRHKPSESGNNDDRMIRLATDLMDLLDSLQTTLSVADSALYKDLRPALGNVVDEVFNEVTLQALSWRFSVISDDISVDDITRMGMKFINEELDILLKVYKSRLEEANTIPSPPQYAKSSIWAEWQQKDTAILCFRPSDKQGLPLCVLDNVFREFQRQATAPLPKTEDARKAMNAAFDLCHTMPDDFATDLERGQVFDRCLDPIIPHFSWREKAYLSASTELHSGQANKNYGMGGVVHILREDKVESGTGDDAYMQVSRAYQLYVEYLRNRKPSLLKQGAPVFLLCVIGPMLLICGGFHDTRSTIVEPLVQPCLMFADFLHTRQEDLARQLFALKQALVTLCSRSPFDEDTVNDHPAGVPRIYTTYTAEDNTERSLRFLRPLKERLPQPLLFIAAEDPPDSSTDKLVKLAVGRYGFEAHRLLAKHQLAPVLYGQQSLEGAPTAYVMEFLSPPTLSKSGWVTLFEFFKLRNLSTQYSHAIRIALDRILTVMEEAEVVHGDLRPNNIMLEVDSDSTPVRLGEEGVNLRVVDFDWAGESGKAYYPLQRNEDIAWPGGAGTPIIVGHDRLLVRDWWSKHFSSMF